MTTDRESYLEWMKHKYLADSTTCPNCEHKNIGIIDSGLDERLEPLDMDKREIQCGGCQFKWKEIVKKVVVDVDFTD